MNTKLQMYFQELELNRDNNENQKQNVNHLIY